MTTTSDKLRQIKPFVNIKIPINKKNFKPWEKGLISRYYNILDNQGYFNYDNIGYQLLDISSKKAPKVLGAPKLKKRFVEVGTVIENGIMKTNPNRKAIVKNGKIYVKDKGGQIRIWRFQYNIAKNWTQESLAKHLKRQIGKQGLKKNQSFVIGAGLKYEVGGIIDRKLENLAGDILKIGYGYTPNLTKQYEHNGQKKYLKDWLQEIVVYEYDEDLLKRQQNRRMKTKRKPKGANNGKRNRRN